MSERQSTSPRRRLRALRAIPDSDRTDEQWDELNELEIMLAPANRVAPLSAPANRRSAEPAPRSRQSRADGPRANNGSHANAAKPHAARAANSEASSAAPRRKPAKRVRRKSRSPSPVEGG